MESILDYIESGFDSANCEIDKIIEIDSKREYPQDITEFKSYIEECDIIINKFESVKLEYDFSKFKNKLEEERAYKINEVRKKKEKQQNDFDSKLDFVESSIREEVEQKKKERLLEHNQDNEVYLLLEEKRKELEKYSDFIISQCSANGITTKDISMSNEDYSVEEWSKIYDDALVTVKSVKSLSNPITKFKEIIQNDRIILSVSFLLVLILVITPVFDFIGAVFIGYLMFSQSQIKNKSEKSSILLGLLYNIKPLEMGFDDSIDMSDLDDIDSIINEDERMTLLMEEFEEVEDTSELDYIVSECDRLKLQFTEDYSNAVKLSKEKIQEIGERVTDCIAEIRVLKEGASSDFEEQKSKVKLVGDYVSESVVFNTKYMLGLKDGCIPEYKDLGLTNILIRPGSDTELSKQFLQLMVANALCNSAYRTVNMHFFDPNNMCNDILGFYTELTDPVIHTYTENLDKLIGDLKTIGQRNLKVLRGVDILTYNKESEETGRAALTYEFLVILSQGDKLSKDESMASFLASSAKMGIFVWLVTEEDYDNCIEFNIPYEGISNPLTHDSKNWPKKFGDKFGKDMDNAKPKSLPWSKYVEKSFKEDEEWNIETNKFVWFEPGFIDGDPSRNDHFTLGTSGDPHGIIAGTSGSGKSVLIQNLIANMTKRHGPKDLRLWLVDFKGSEFALYLKGEECPYQLPHIDACLCTSDPEYASSLFKAFREQAEARYNMFIDNGYRDLVEYNEDMENKGTPEKKLPQVVCIVDEYQVIYVKGTPTLIGIFNNELTLIAKVARAAGYHLVFASQSMAGTLNKDTLGMFTLRMCLRCEREVSEMILGTPFANTNLTSPNGWLYVSSSKVAKKELQPKYNTPYITKEEIFSQIEHFDKKAKEVGWQRTSPVIEYSERTKHPINELVSIWNKLEPLIEEGKADRDGVIYLGNRMRYSTNRVPENISLIPSNGSNVLCSANSLKDLVNLFETFRVNFEQWNEKCNIIYFSQQEQLSYLFKYDEVVPEKYKEWASYTCDIRDSIDIMSQMVKARKEKGIKKRPLVFVCAGFDTCVGFGIDPDSRITDKLNLLLKTAGENNVHWIFLGQQLNKIPNNIQGSCNYKIAAKVSEVDSMALLKGSVLASKVYENMRDSYAFLSDSDGISRFKIYQSENLREIKSSKVIITEGLI